MVPTVVYPILDEISVGYLIPVGVGNCIASHVQVSAKDGCPFAGLLDHAHYNIKQSLNDTVGFMPSHLGQACTCALVSIKGSSTGVLFTCMCTVQYKRSESVNTAAVKIREIAYIGLQSVRMKPNQVESISRCAKNTFCRPKKSTNSSFPAYYPAFL